MKRIANTATILLFAAGLIVQAYGFLFREAEWPATEKRPQNAPPPLILKRWAFQVFPFMFDAYFNDRVGYRTELLDIKRDITYGIFGETTSNIVWVGKNGWLYLDNVGTSPRSQSPDGTLEPNVEAWASAIEKRRDWLAKRGIVYIVYIAREKSIIYPEHLPDSLQRHPPADLVPGLLARLKQANVRAVDPYIQLIAAKPTAIHPLYFVNDSHWSGTGMSVGYRPLADELELAVPGYRAKPDTAFNFLPYVRMEADLTTALGLKPGDKTEATVHCGEPNNPSMEVPDDDVAALLLSGGKPLAHLPSRRTVCPTATPRAVMLHDSFGPAAEIPLAEHASRLVTLAHEEFLEQRIELDNPEILLELYTERRLTHWPPSDLQGELRMHNSFAPASSGTRTRRSCW